MNESTTVKLLKLKEVLEIVPVSKAKWYRLVREGSVPKPISIGKRNRFWKESDVHEYLRALS